MQHFRFSNSKIAHGKPMDNKYNTFSSKSGRKFSEQKIKFSQHHSEKRKRISEQKKKFSQHNSEKRKRIFSQQN